MAKPTKVAAPGGKRYSKHIRTQTINERCTRHSADTRLERRLVPRHNAAVAEHNTVPALRHPRASRCFPSIATR